MRKNEKKYYFCHSCRTDLREENKNVHDRLGHTITKHDNWHDLRLQFVKKRKIRDIKNPFAWSLFFLVWITTRGEAAPKEKITLEAERGFLTSPMRIDYGDQASADLFIQSSSNSVGNADYFFHTTLATTTYVIWARVLSVDPSHDSFFVSVDTGPEDVFDTSENHWSPDWQWMMVGGRNGTTLANTLYPRTFTLNRGLHAIHLRAREPDVGLDQLMVTNDLTLSSQTLKATVLFHSCPSLPPRTSDLCVQNIIQYQIKPIYESPTLTSLQKCQQIHDIMEQKIEPLLSFDNAEVMKKWRANCSTCPIFNQWLGCPWDVLSSTPAP